MTTVFTEEVQCIICGKTCEQTFLGSTSAFGSPDLDGRPPELKRGSIIYWVQECPYCGYCFSTISEGKPEYKEIVSSESYKALLRDEHYPHLARRFLCWAMLEASSVNIRQEFNARLAAAWICDDEHCDEAARSCRMTAVSAMEKAKSQGIIIFESELGADGLVQVDLLRRVGEFSGALSTCEEALSKDSNDLFKTLFMYERQLISEEDSACHTTEEAAGHLAR